MDKDARQAAIDRASAQVRAGGAFRRADASSKVRGHMGDEELRLSGMAAAEDDLRVMREQIRKSTGWPTEYLVSSPVVITELVEPGDWYMVADGANFSALFQDFVTRFWRRWYEGAYADAEDAFWRERYGPGYASDGMGV